MSECWNLTALPEGLFDGLAGLTSIDLFKCYDLTALPEGLFGGLTGLTSVKGITHLATPEMLEDLRARGVNVQTKVE